MDDIFIYVVDLPPGINEMVAPCEDGNFTIYLSAKLSMAGQQRAYKHAIHHILNNDFQKDNVQQIEAEAHGIAPTVPKEETYEEKRRKCFEAMRKRNEKARKRIQRQLAKKQKQVDILLETDDKYRMEHDIFGI